MTGSRTSRRQVVAGTVAAAAASLASPFVRTAHAAGKLTIALWDHWVPGANKPARQVIEEWAAKEKVEVQIDYITVAGQQAAADRAGRGAGQDRPRHHDVPLLGPGRSPRDARACRRHHGGSDQAERCPSTRRRVSRQAWRPLGGGAGDAGQQRQGTVLAHRPLEAARRHRRAGHVSGRRAAEGGRLDARRLPQGGRGLPQGRRPVRHRARHDGRLGRYAPARSSTRFGAALVDAKGNITVKTDAVRQALEYYVRLARFLPAGRARPGRCLEQQDAWSPARAR